jgi:ligand-binding sensor domain-containing protein
VGASNGLNRWQDGHVTFYGNPPGSSADRRTGDVRTVPLLGSAVRSMALDDRDRLWVGIKDGVYFLEGERAVRVPGIPGGFVLCIAHDRDGSVWVSVADEGLFHWTGDGSVQRFPWESLGNRGGGAAALLPDAPHGLWVGFREGGVAYFKDGRVVNSWRTADGLGGGNVTHLRSGEHGAVWVASEGGLSRIADGKVRTLTTRQGLPCDAVYWSIEDENRSTWIYTACASCGSRPPNWTNR